MEKTKKIKKAKEFQEDQIDLQNFFTLDFNKSEDETNQEKEKEKEKDKEKDNQPQKEEKFRFNYVSKLTSHRKPDVYFGTNVINAKNYKVIQPNTTIKPATAEDPSSTSESENKDELKKENRYFSTANISIKCYNCGEVGHMSRSCPHERMVLCIKCNKIGHESSECPNVKCFKCNRIGHRYYECKAPKNIETCDRCKSKGHVGEDCLADPIVVPSKKIKKLNCYFCGQKGHLICPISKDSLFVINDYLSDNVVLSDEDEAEAIGNDKNNLNLEEGELETSKQLRKVKSIRIFEGIDNQDIINYVFCPKCAGNHVKEDCKVRLKENALEARRNNFNKRMNENSSYRSSNYRDRDRDRYYPSKDRSRDKYRDKEQDYRSHKHHKFISSDEEDFSKSIERHRDKRDNDRHNNGNSNKKRRRNDSSSTSPNRVTIEYRKGKPLKIEKKGKIVLKEKNSDFDFNSIIKDVYKRNKKIK